MKIFDCFLFFNEKEILIDRLRYLCEKVDKFIIAESTYTFTGIEKKICCEQIIKENVPEIFDKVVLILNTEYVCNQNVGKLMENIKPSFICEIAHYMASDNHNSWTWINDYYQREILRTGIEKYSVEGDVIVLSDIDEVPAKNFYSFVAKNKLEFASMKQFRYNLRVQDKSPWIGSVKFQKSMLGERSLNYLRFYTKTESSDIDYSVSLNCGWHFTSFGRCSDVLRKIHSWGHQELNTPINRMMLSKRIQRGLDPFGRDMKFKISDERDLPKEFSSIRAQFGGAEVLNCSFYFMVINEVLIFFDKCFRRLQQFKIYFGIIK